jgi:hypothetical protein
MELLLDIVAGGVIAGISFYMGYRSGWSKGFEAAEGVWVPAINRLNERLMAELRAAYGR